MDTELIYAVLRALKANARMLIRMKRDTVRPQDRADAERLRRQFQIEDE